MKILGISPLDKDATISLVEDGKVLYAAGEERFSRVKQHAGFPHKSLASCLAYTDTAVEDIDRVDYAFYAWDEEKRLIDANVESEAQFSAGFGLDPGLQRRLAAAEAKVPKRAREIAGLASPNERMEKDPIRRALYRFAGASPALFPRVGMSRSRAWAARAEQEHRHWHGELESGLREAGLLPKLSRQEHHLSHAANAYLASGFERALVVTLDGYGSGLAGSISLGEGGGLTRVHNIEYPHSLGTFYEMVTSALGYRPDRHAGKIVGLAAYGDPSILGDIVLTQFEQRPGDYRILGNNNAYFSRHLAARFPKIDVAAAYQEVLEQVAGKLVRHWVEKLGTDAVVLSGGVTANVKMNQRIHEVDGVERIFVYPNMGDGGCGTGLAFLASWPGGIGAPITDTYLGPSYDEAAIGAALDEAGLAYDRPSHLAAEVAKRIFQGQVVARFDGRMEYGPRALGNRSILYHAREPDVNQWLNSRLGRTEFMPFAPVTLYEERERLLPTSPGGGAHRPIHDDHLRLHALDEGELPGCGARRRHREAPAHSARGEPRLLRCRQGIREALRHPLSHQHQLQHA